MNGPTGTARTGIDRPLKAAVTVRVLCTGFLLLGAATVPADEPLAPRRGLVARAGHAVVGFYRSQISPAIGRRCSLHPSCSEYACRALDKHGLLALPLIADRAVREPGVVAAQADPVTINGRRLYRDPLDAHDAWLCGGPATPLSEIMETAPPARRSPRLGGILGLVPGLGYAYSGEYANALRSLLLNGIFIWGMVETAGEEQWGGFAVISFFELTWYSGSIYGGIDAAHRFNARQRGAQAGPDGAGLAPLLALELAF
ncbi:MAG: membrane protein insertion efficiency factor YidD [Lentisphaerae bacterium]|nr:membrane protein insertion efficiency factor YidD [Lentisphaerota bacterium]